MKCCVRNCEKNHKDGVKFLSFPKKKIHCSNEVQQPQNLRRKAWEVFRKT
ncbi:Uncharacterized protein APZ42_003099 [Daphnia magna]|uniref:THAP-type domain-containing protein n=1 Tax=Daphnia magna TaxID=35525 RepID=A0A164HTZ8_9CRUS|nr:Uncharacterized protein APZ42_003099 [Daphnia magna]